MQKQAAGPGAYSPEDMEGFVKKYEDLGYFDSLLQRMYTLGFYTGPEYE